MEIKFDLQDDELTRKSHFDIKGCALRFEKEVRAGRKNHLFTQKVNIIESDLS